MNLNLQLFIVERKCFHTEIWHLMSEAKWFGFPFSISFKNTLWLHSVLREAGGFLWFYMLFVLPWQGLIHGKKNFQALSLLCQLFPF